MRCMFPILPLVALFSVVVTPALAQEGIPFDPGCTLPFVEIAVRQEIDEDCGPAGLTNSTRSQIQNRAKNNFCAAGAPTVVDIAQLRALHIAVQNAGLPYNGNSAGNGGLPNENERDQLATIGAGGIGEGNLVQFVGFVDDARYSNVSRGETVNCRRPRIANNDIHIELGETLHPASQNRISAEVSPHFRPAEWTPAAIEATSEVGRRVRLTGQLFFDASHNAAPDGNNFRASSWEIHPIYAIDVCLLGTTCDPANATHWMPLHQWDPDAEDELAAAQEITLAVDLQGETATITNNTSSAIPMGDWELVSVQGNQRFTFPAAFSLAAGASVVVTSGPGAVDDPANGFIRWTGSRIWNNSGDPGRLLDADGNVVAETQ